MLKKGAIAESKPEGKTAESKAGSSCEARRLYKGNF
jgi:hypothetical protein